MRRVLLLLLALLMCAAPACSSVENDTSTGFMLYFRVSGSRGADGKILGTQPLNVGGEELNLEYVMRSLLSGPGAAGNLISPFPDGVDLLYWELDGGTATLTLSGAYASLAGMKRTIADACITQTLLQFENIAGVAIRAGVMGTVSAVMDSDSFELLERRDSTSERVITLYFPMNDAAYLDTEQQTLVVAEADAVERYVIEEILKGPKGANKHSVIPAGTELRSIRTEKGICYVDLSSDFYDNRTEDAQRELLAVYSIVNSLTALSNVRKVQLLIEGKAYQKYLNLHLDIPLGENKYLNYPKEDAYAYSQVTIYVRRNNDEYVSPLEILFKPAEYSGEAQTITEALLGFEAPIGYEPLFAGGPELLSIAVRSGICYINFSHDLLDTPMEQLRYSVYALTASLTRLDSVDKVQVLVDGSVRDDLPFDISQPFDAQDVAIGP